MKRTRDVFMFIRVEANDQSGDRRDARISVSSVENILVQVARSSRHVAQPRVPGRDCMTSADRRSPLTRLPPIAKKRLQEMFVRRASVKEKKEKTWKRLRIRNALEAQLASDPAYPDCDGPRGGVVASEPADHANSPGAHAYFRGEASDRARTSAGQPRAPFACGRAITGDRAAGGLLPCDSVAIAPWLAHGPCSFQLGGLQTRRLTGTVPFAVNSDGEVLQDHSRIGPGNARYATSCAAFFPTDARPPVPVVSRKGRQPVLGRQGIPLGPFKVVAGDRTDHRPWARCSQSITWNHEFYVCNS